MPAPAVNPWDPNADPNQPQPTSNVPTGTGDPNAGLEQLTGFSSRYNPSQLSNLVWENPWAVLPDVFKNINMSGPGYQALRDLGVDPTAIYNITQGAGSDLTSAGAGGYTNWLANLYKTLGTPGGQTFNSRDMLRNIFKQGTGSNTALGRLMSSGQASQQVQTLFGLIQEAANAGMNPMAARGYIDAARRAGDLYANEMLRAPANKGTNQQMITEWMRTKFPGLVPT